MRREENSALEFLLTFLIFLVSPVLIVLVSILPILTFALIPIIMVLALISPFIAVVFSIVEALWNVVMNPRSMESEWEKFIKGFNKNAN